MTEQEEEDKGKEKAHEKEIKKELQATKEELRKAYEDGLRHGNEKNYNTMWNLRDITYEDNTEIKYNKINWT